MFSSLIATAVLAIAAPAAGPAGPAGELIAPLDPTHNHASCIVECPNGDLLACWYRGAGERQADDVRIVGARLKRGAARWHTLLEMADTADLPDCNPCMIIDSTKRLWLFWPVILDNHWESALLKYRTSRDFQGGGPPKWEQEKVLHLKPGPEFAAVVNRDLIPQSKQYLDRAAGTVKEKLQAYIDSILKKATDKLSVRLGWMPRAHPFLDGDRLLLPLYSDGFDFSMVAYTDDRGASWKTSEPMVGAGNVQPSIVRRKDGSLVAFYRDNGPPPKRVMVSESVDHGSTWSLPRDIAVPNPGAGVEAVALKSGRWLLVNNPTERGRNILAVHISEDEGRTWTAIRYLENDSAGPNAGSYSYPSILQARDGTIHVTYSYSIGPGRESASRARTGESIKHVHFTESELMSGWMAK